MRHKYDGFFQFALKENRLVSVRDVDNGLKCGCICPKCGEKLIAYNSPENKNTFHFQHQSLKECHGVYETMVHFLAKEVIHDQGSLVVPDVFYSLTSYASGYDFDSGITEEVAEKMVHFDSVEVEKSNALFRPDLKCTSKGKIIFIEIAVTHFVDEAKEKKIYKEGKPVLEIDLSSRDRITTKEQLSQILRWSIEQMRWINNAKIADRLLKAQNDAKDIVTFVNRNIKTLKVYGKKRLVYCPRFKIDFQKVNADDVCKRSCCCFVRELEGDPNIDELDGKKAFIQCVGHVAAQYFQLLKLKGITVNERIHL